jgi:hypothetical protein
VAKKYNKSREQKPNYTKRGKESYRVEAGTDFDLDSKLSDSKLKEEKNSSSCSNPRQR